MFNKFGAYIKNIITGLNVNTSLPGTFHIIQVENKGNITITMAARISKTLCIFLTVVILLCFSNIACTKASNKTIMQADTTTHITPTDTTKPPHTDTIPVVQRDTTLRTYLALGDSYTIGQAVSENERFPAQAAAALVRDSINMGTPQYIATTGWTTINLQNAIAAQHPVGPYDAVTLLIGVNDQYQHLDTGGYRTRFAQLLQQAVQLAGNRKERVFVLSIPDYSVTPYGGGDTTIRDQVNEFNAINKKITLNNNVAYIDITPASRLAATQPNLVASDGLHPSGAQYALWVQLLAPVMEKALK